MIPSSPQVRMKDVIALAATQHDEMRALWMDIYAYYSAPVTKMQLRWFATDCSDFSVVQVLEAFDIWRNTLPTGKRRPAPPVPAELIALLRPQVDLDAEAACIAARMFGSISKYGRPGSSRAREAIGPAGWWAVEQLGGWSTLCADTLAEDRKTLTAQWRDLVKGYLQTAGTQTQQRLKLEAQQRMGDLTGITEVLNAIEQR